MSAPRQTLIGLSLQKLANYSELAECLAEQARKAGEELASLGGV